VVFDSYEKEDGKRKSQYGRYGKLKLDGSTKHEPNNDNNGFKHVIRYDDGMHLRNPHLRRSSRFSGLLLR